MSRWLSIVGIGEDGLDGITPAARVLVDQAEVLVGGARHLAMVADDHPAERLPWVPPMAASAAAVVARAPCPRPRRAATRKLKASRSRRRTACSARTADS